MSRHERHFEREERDEFPYHPLIKLAVWAAFIALTWGLSYGLWLLWRAI